MSNIYTVTQVGNYVKSIITRDPVLVRISIKGEISNCKYHSSGHIYFSIKDDGAQLKCIMFSRDRALGLDFKLEDGQSVVVTGRLSFYERDGGVNMYVTEVALDGIGALYERYEQLKRKLLNEGLFDANHKKPIPAYVKRLGIVTASTGAALRDILNVTKRRNPYVQPILYPAKVQGDGAAETVVNAIEALDNYGVDVIIVARGGGSIEDLWAFNEEIVARAVYKCKTPVVSGVGHETDTTIIDYVSDFRAPTPSAAAEVCVYEYSKLSSGLVDAHADLVHLLTNKIAQYNSILEHYQKVLDYNNPKEKLNQYKLFLDESASSMELALKNKVAGVKATLETRNIQLKNLVDKRLQATRHELNLLTQRLSDTSPLAKISSGYGYVSKDGLGLRSIENVAVGDNLTVTLKDGSIDCQVTDKLPDDLLNK